MDWTEETIAHLRQLWAEGHSTAEIGRRMGISKNAVVGKAHRLQLDARPSPIRREGAVPKRPTPARSLVQPAAEPTHERAGATLRAVAAPRSAVRMMPCCWPIGEPGTPAFRFCDEPATPGKPYCAAHVQLAYVKVRDRRDEDAA